MPAETATPGKKCQPPASCPHIARRSARRAARNRLAWATCATRWELPKQLRLARLLPRIFSPYRPASGRHRPFFIICRNRRSLLDCGDSIIELAANTRKLLYFALKVKLAVPAPPAATVTF